MKLLYQIADMSRQALHKSNKRMVERCVHQHQIFEQADAIRKEHPGVGCRKMGRALRKPGWGRDKLEQLLLNGGYRVIYRRRFVKTTQRQSIFHYPNLIEGNNVDGVNQVVQTDITYYRVKDRFYYMTFIKDIYSRRILGYNVSSSLHASSNVKALKMMLTQRKEHSLLQMIHHSDKGSQYISKPYLKLLQDNKIRISMCDAAWQNAYAERLNRTIKEEYLDGWSIKNYEELKRSVRKAVKHYNEKRQHQSLQWNSPINFERQHQEKEKYIELMG